jgi:carbonic anhydrase
MKPYRFSIAWPFIFLVACAESARAPTAVPSKEPAHWSYDDPNNWGHLSPEWAACSTGRTQSPIDISTRVEKDKALKPLSFSYEPLPLRLMNDGHLIEVENTTTSTLTAAGRKWDLVQFHFHAPSEHTIGGKAFDGELHLVHKDEAGSDLAVVGLFLKKGRENQALAPVFDHAPTMVSTEPRTIDNTKVDLRPLLPANATYYTYHGSLTTPPCTEFVTWFVVAEPVEVSEAQLKSLTDAVGAHTARPVQPLNGRAVQAYR